MTQKAFSRTKSPIVDTRSHNAQNGTAELLRIGAKNEFGNESFRAAAAIGGRAKLAVTLFHPVSVLSMNVTMSCQSIATSMKNCCLFRSFGFNSIFFFGAQDLN